MLLNKSPSQPTVLFRFSTRVSVTRPGQFVNTTMAEVIKVWQDYLSEPLNAGTVIGNDELLASAVSNLMKTLGSFGYDDILLRTQVKWFCASHGHMQDIHWGDEVLCKSAWSWAVVASIEAL